MPSFIHLMSNVMVTKEKMERLASKARNSISEYCFNECHAYCCRKGYLLLTPKEADLLSDHQKKEMVVQKILTVIRGGKYVLDLGLHGCPQLRAYKCCVHKNSGRSLACKEFPLFISGHNIRLSRRCPAVRENILYPYLAKFKLLGYNIEGFE